MMAKINVLKLATDVYVVKINGTYMADFVDGHWKTKTYRTEADALYAEDEYRRFNKLQPRSRDSELE